MRCLGPGCGRDGLSTDVEVCPGCGAHQPSLLRDVLPSDTVLHAGTYRLVEPLGRGGFGITYRAERVRLQQPVAVKELYPQDLAFREPATGRLLVPEPRRAAFASTLQRFVREGRLLARVDHPNVVRVHDLFEERGTAYLVMDLVAGHTLRSELDAQPGGRLPPARIEAIVGQLVAALACLHAADVLHLDLKPENVLLAPDGRTILVDFGSARQHGSDGRTATVTRTFTEAYAPPELRSGRDISPASDVFELGVVLGELLTGTRPRPDWTANEAAAWRTADLPEPWRTLVARALRPRPEDRPADVRAWWDGRLGTGSHGSTSAPAPPLSYPGHGSTATGRGTPPWPTLGRTGRGSPDTGGLAPRLGGWQNGHQERQPSPHPEDESGNHLEDEPGSLFAEPAGPPPLGLGVAWSRQLAEPVSAVAVDQTGDVYVLTWRTVEKLGPDGRPLLSMPLASPAPGEPDLPRGLAVGADGTLYVANTGRHCIDVYRPGATGPVARWGRYGTAPGEFHRPGALALDGLGTVYVADTLNHRVQVLSPRGAPLTEWTGAAGREPRLRGPEHLVLDAAGTLYVAGRGASSWSRQTYRYTPDGTPRPAWAAFGGLAVGPDERLWVADERHRRLLVLDAHGDEAGVWPLPADVVRLTGPTGGPRGVAADPGGALYVVLEGSTWLLKLTTAQQTS